MAGEDRTEAAPSLGGRPSTCIGAQDGSAPPCSLAVEGLPSGAPAAKKRRPSSSAARPKLVKLVDPASDPASSAPLGTADPSGGPTVAPSTGRLSLGGAFGAAGGPKEKQGRAKQQRRGKSLPDAHARDEISSANHISQRLGGGETAPPAFSAMDMTIEARRPPPSESVRLEGDPLVPTRSEAPIASPAVPVLPLSALLSTTGFFAPTVCPIFMTPAERKARAEEEVS